MTAVYIGSYNSPPLMSPYPNLLSILFSDQAFISFSLLFLIGIYSELHCTDFTQQPRHRIGERRIEGKMLVPTFVSASVREHVCSLGKHTHVLGCPSAANLTLASSTNPTMRLHTQIVLSLKSNTSHFSLVFLLSGF